MSGAPLDSHEFFPIFAPTMTFQGKGKWQQRWPSGPNLARARISTEPVTGGLQLAGMAKAQRPNYRLGISPKKVASFKGKPTQNVLTYLI